MKNLSILLVICLFGANLIAQGDDVRGPISYPAPGVMDGVYMESNIPTKKVVPYEFVREADVVWSKKVWQVIDLREKFNHPLYFPLDDIEEGMWKKNTTRWSLWTIIRHHIMTGELTLYSPFNPEWEAWKDGDLFKYPVTPSTPGGNYYNDKDFKDRMFVYIGTEKLDPFASALKSLVYPDEDSLIMGDDGFMETVYPPSDTLWFKSKDIVQYNIKEQVFVDKERSVQETRILGIAPMVYARDNNGNITGFRELFWLYFPQCRYVFQNFFVHSAQNDAQRMSFDDLFWKRKFTSYIVKESNLYDRDIDTYKAGVDALLESEKIKADIFNFEHDLWSF
jgi:gliding motility associated protien GldN